MQPYPRAPDLVWPGHLHWTGCHTVRAMDTGFPTVVWRPRFGMGLVLRWPLWFAFLFWYVLGYRFLPACFRPWLGLAVCVGRCRLRLFHACLGWGLLRVCFGAAARSVVGMRIEALLHSHLFQLGVVVSARPWVWTKLPSSWSALHVVRVGRCFVRTPLFLSWPCGAWSLLEFC